MTPPPAEVGRLAGTRGAHGNIHAVAYAARTSHTLKTQSTTIMPEITFPAHKDGDVLVNYEEKVFEDIKANPGEKALVTFHGVAHEGSIGLVNTLVATRLLRKGYETSILLYGPGVTMGFQKGFPTLGDEAFPGHLLVNKRLAQFMAEGGKIYACRFSTQALYGQTEKAFIPGIIPINPLDVLDINLVHGRAGAVVIHSWNL
jgi:uncharacterized repeat protein (TIGR04044 family)